MFKINLNNNLNST